MDEFDAHGDDTSVTIAGKAISITALASMSASELGMFLLAAMKTSGKAEWSTGNLGAVATASVVDSLRGRTRPRDLRPQISQFIADAMRWLISFGLVGPSALSSGSSSEWQITTAGCGAGERFGV